MNFYTMGDEKNPGSFVPSLNDIVIEKNVSLNAVETSDGSENSDHSLVEPPIVLSHILKRKLDIMLALEVPEEDKTNMNSSGGQKIKKPRVSKDVQRCMKNARSKKNQKLDRSDENEAHETNTGLDGHDSSSYTSEPGEGNTNQENSEGATASSSKSPAPLNLNGKTRASRKRRERINERLRILQNLVPNGTKVDISTMLEEALHYVKFLQHQIKLLSSDDLWMYAPIAHNGLDIGLNLSNKITPPY